MEIKKKRLRLKEGDVFLVPIDDMSIGYGQIVKIPNRSQLFICIFEGRWKLDEQIELNAIVSQPILFLGHTTDALLFHRKWILVGNIIGNLSSIKLPLYKIGFASEARIINYKQEVVRIATQNEERLLPFQSSNSPIGYQKALQAHYKLIEYDFNSTFSYKNIINTLEILGINGSAS